MNSSSGPVGVIVAVLILGGAVYLALNAKSDRAKYEELRIGMTVQEVQAIVGPKTGSSAHFHTDIGDNENLNVSGVMELTIRNGRLVGKKWLKKEKGP